LRPAREQGDSSNNAYFVSTQTSGRRIFFHRDAWANLITEVLQHYWWVHEVWQQGFTDHRIHDEADWQHHLQYIRMNPVKGGLVEDSVLYPWMNFPNPDFPQGLKPKILPCQDVRAEARTLQSSVHSFPRSTLKSS
jgi:hypothetical protein